MCNKKQFTVVSLLLVLGAILAACQGQVDGATKQVGPTFDAAGTEAVPTAEAKVEAVDLREESVDDADVLPLDAELMDDWVRPADGMTMVFVPEGSFHMGKEQGFSRERPVHEVSLKGFRIDRTEVTNEQYALCVNEGSCEPSEYAGDSEFYGNNNPAVGVSWFDANSYCEWADARLPTEAEWEYAARGPEGLVYPWGEEFEGTMANSCDTRCTLMSRTELYDDGYKFAAPVGSYPEGASWAGALDMSGNVREWVNDWYDEAYYGNSPALNPQGPDGGEKKVLRGGAWNQGESDLRSSNRAYVNPDDRVDNTGFRCVVTPGNGST